RRSAIDVIDNRLHCLTHARTRNFLLQTMSRDKTLRDRFFDGCREVHVVDAVITRAWIENTRLETGGWELHERVTFANSDRFGHRDNLPDKLSGRIARESQSGFDFGVLWKVFRVWQIERAASWIESICSLLTSLQRVRDIVNVAQVEVRGINQNAIAFFSHD